MPKPCALPHFLTVAEVAAPLSICRKSVLRRIAGHDLPAFLRRYRG